MDSSCGNPALSSNNNELTKRIHGFKSSESRSGSESAYRSEASTLEWPDKLRVDTSGASSSSVTISDSGSDSAAESGYVTPRDITGCSTSTTSQKPEQPGSTKSKLSVTKIKHFPEKPPNSYLYFAVGITLVVPLFGIPAICMSVQTRRHIRADNNRQAWSYADKTLILCLLGMWTALLCGVIAYYYTLFWEVGLDQLLTMGHTEPQNVTGVDSYVKADEIIRMIDRPSIRPATPPLGKGLFD